MFSERFQLQHRLNEKSPLITFESEMSQNLDNLDVRNRQQSVEKVNKGAI